MRVVGSRTVYFCLVFVFVVVESDAQTSAILQGRVFDAAGAVMPGAFVSVRNAATGFEVLVASDAEGRYQIAALPAASYTMTVEVPGFRTEVIGQLVVDVGRTLVRDFHLVIAHQVETVVINAEVPLLDHTPSSISHVVPDTTIEQTPLNGRHFMDLSLLVPSAVAPSQSGFSSRPIRGVGALAFNVAGNREEAVTFLVNGVSTNNLTFGSLIFEPPLGSIQQFKVDTGVLGAEYGHVSGAAVTIVTRSGTDRFHGELFEFLRNDAFDARNFFEFTSPRPHPFTRNQFGGVLGGPIQRGRTFFFATYEGFRQRQGVDMNSLVLSDEQRAAATGPVIRRLLPLIPRANYFDADGTPRYVGSARAAVDTDRWTLDLQHGIGANDRIHGYYGSQRLRSNEPGSQGNSIPGFGIALRPLASILTLNDSHVIGTAMLNEARFGRSRLIGKSLPATQLNPADFGIGNGVSRPIGLPQLVVAGDLNFGGPGSVPQGRTDTSYVFNDTFSRVTTRHAVRLGGEYRHFINKNFAEGTGVFNFPTVASFLAENANAFSITLGQRTSVIDQRAVSFFGQDQIAISGRVTLDFGIRYEWHVTPTERDNRFVVFDPETVSLLRIGVDTQRRIYGQNDRNIEPRIGVMWDPSGEGHTIVRAGYGRTADEPGTTAVRDIPGNPPFAMPLTGAGSIPLTNAVEMTRPAGLAPSTIDRAFRNAVMDSWNVSIQRQLTSDTAVAGGYIGSRGRQLRISRNINQPVNGVRPYPALSSNSPVRPGSPLGNITQVESSGFSSYRAAWLSLTKRLSHGLQLDTSYTFSKSMDTNSLNSSGFAVQDAYNIAGEYGLSDFDARHRFVLSAISDLPIRGNVLVRGWQIATVVQAQSGNPINIVTSNSTLNGVPNTVRPDVASALRMTGSVDQWFDPSSFVAADHFGNLPRNAVRGPGFSNVDLSLMKTMRERTGQEWQLRVDAFNALNHANFASPGNVLESPAFGKITRTRLPTGEAGSSRQVQLAMRLSF